MLYYAMQEPWRRDVYSQRKQRIEQKIAGDVFVDGYHHPHLDNPQPIASAILKMLFNENTWNLTRNRKTKNKNNVKQLVYDIMMD